MTRESDIQEALAKGDFETVKSLIAEAEHEHNKTKDFIHRSNNDSLGKKTKKAKRAKFEVEFKNEFVDDGIACAADKEFDKKFKMVRANLGRRPSPKKVEATCYVCGRTEKVNPAFVTRTIGDDELERYRCNKCCCGY